MGAEHAERPAGVGRLKAVLTDQPAALYAVLVVGAALRLYELGAESYWIDELLSLEYIASRGPVELALEIPFIDPHPPLFYILLDLWTMVAGTSEAGTRLLSAIFGIAALPVLYLVGRELYDEWVGVLAAGLLALSRFHVRNSQNARMYSLLVLATLVSMYLLLRLRTDPSRRNAVAYTVSTLVLVYTHVFGVLVLVAQHCYYVAGPFVREDGGFPVPIRTWLGSQAVVGALTLPWGVGIAQQALALLTGGGTGGTPNLDWIPDPTLLRLADTFGRYVYAGTRTATVVDESLYGVLALVFVGILLLASASRVPLDRERTTLLVCWVGVPVFGLFVVSYLLTPLYVDRYTIAALPAVMLLLSKEVRRTERVEIRYIVLAVLLVSLTAGTVGFYGSAQNHDWRGSTAFVAEHADGDDAVLTSPAWFDRRFTLYGERQGLDLPVANVSENRAVEGTRAYLEDRDGDVWLVTHTNYSYDTRRKLRPVFNESGYERRTKREFPGVTVELYVEANETNASEAEVSG